MSWSFAFSCTATDFDEVATLAWQKWHEGEHMPEAHDQAAVAVSAAKMLLLSGTIHHMGLGLYDVALSGHANRGNIPRKDTPDDVITVTVRQVAAPAAREIVVEPAPESVNPAPPVEESEETT